MMLIRAFLFCLLSASCVSLFAGNPSHADISAAFSARITSELEKLNRSEAIADIRGVLFDSEVKIAGKERTLRGHLEEKKKAKKWKVWWSGEPADENAALVSGMLLDIFDVAKKKNSYGAIFLKAFFKALKDGPVSPDKGYMADEIRRAMSIANEAVEVAIKVESDRLNAAFIEAALARSRPAESVSEEEADSLPAFMFADTNKYNESYTWGDTWNRITTGANDTRRYVRKNPGTVAAGSVLTAFVVDQIVAYLRGENSLSWQAIQALYGLVTGNKADEKEQLKRVFIQIFEEEAEKKAKAS